jgi:hypothetical protein
LPPGKQVAALVVGLEGTGVTMKFIRNSAHSEEPHAYEVVLLRGGSKSARRLEEEKEEEEAELVAAYEFVVTLIRGGLKGKKRCEEEEAEYRRLVER